MVVTKVILLYFIEKAMQWGLHWAIQIRQRFQCDWSLDWHDGTPNWWQ
jgi:hypothetical protein